jgi:hypothetical protein
MSNLPREYLDDISTQRFQENVARQAVKSNQSITSNSDAIAALQAQISKIPTQAEYADFSITMTSGSDLTITHSFGTVPSGWTILDLVTNNLTNTSTFYRTSWDTATMLVHYTTAGGIGVNTTTAKIRIYK